MLSFLAVCLSGPLTPTAEQRLWFVAKGMSRPVVELILGNDGDVEFPSSDVSSRAAIVHYGGVGIVYDSANRLEKVLR